MADLPYSHRLLVELEENNVKKLKIKLVKYFQSKRLSGGGECEVDHVAGTRTAVLRFRRAEDLQRVLRKQVHEISVDGVVLRMTVRLPTDDTARTETPPQPAMVESDAALDDEQPSIDDYKVEAKMAKVEPAEEESGSVSAILGNVSEALTREFLDMLVENVLKDPDSPDEAPNFTLQLLPELSSAVVTFQSGKENADFVTRCSKHRTFTNKKLSVRPLEVTEQVLIDDTHGFSEDLLFLYFEKAGGEVENVVLNTEDQSGTIIFKHPKAVEKVTKKKHCISRKEIRVYPFYQSLGLALYGEDEPSLKLPAAVSEPVDDAIWTYLTNNPLATETLRTELAKDFCNVNLGQSAVRLSPVSSLLQQPDAKALVKNWRDKVRSAFTQALSKFKSLKLQPESEAWEESEKEVRQKLQNEDVVVVPHKAGGVLWVVGLVADIDRLEPPLCDDLVTIAKRVKRAKSSKTRVIQLSPSVFHLLCEDGLKERLLNVYPELQILFKKESGTLAVTGLEDEILSANTVIVDAVIALKRQNLELDKYVLDLLKDEQQEEITNTLLASSGINAAFEISGHTVQLLATSDKDLKNAEDHLRKLLISQYIDVEDRNVLDKQEWQDLVSQLEKTNNESCRRIRIHVTAQQVVVSGHQDSVASVSSRLGDFLVQNAQFDDSVVVKPDIIVEYIKKLDPSWLAQAGDKVVVFYKKDAICLSGARGDVTAFKTHVEDMVSSVFSEILKISIPGVKKLFKDKRDMYVTSIYGETGCVVQLLGVSDGGQDISDQGLLPKPLYQLRTPDGVEIAVCKADMCSYPVHAVVNASNKELKHDGGLSEALLKAAGPQFQDECDKLIEQFGQVKTGECVITEAGGKLRCKKVIHAVGPTFDISKPQKALAQLKRAVKGSLELAEKHRCPSVALPAISRNLGFPLNMCADTIARAVKEHCDEMYEAITLKRIHLVNNDDATVQAVLEAVRREFGGHGAGVSQQTKPNMKVKVAGSHPDCLAQTKTKEGLRIKLIKGGIQHATTDVTVNTVAEDLSLDKGVISRAILKEAGQTLQQLVHANQTSANIGDVIVTEGCNLKSTQVFHAVVPHWDKGKGAAQNVLSSIVRDCLSKAEASGLRSITFPAIGTGNLGFPKDLVATLMLDEMLAFSSSKQPKHLKKVEIVLYSQDDSTIQAFTDEFMKKFPGATDGQCPAFKQRSGPFSKVVSSSGMHETKMGNVTIQVATGDITKETCDVIINSSNEQFTLKSGVSKAILDAAGPAVETECQTLGAQANTGIILTQPGNLKCKKILHLVGQTDPGKIKNVVKKALEACVNTYTSVSFPAIGTGQGNVQPKQVADAMLDAVIDVLSQFPSGPLKTVRIVIFQPHMLKDFYISMNQRETADVKDKKGFWGRIGDQIRGLFDTGNDDDEPQKDDDFVIEALKVEPTSFHICGKSQAHVDSAKQKINRLISQEQNSICIPDNTILRFSKADHQRIADMQKTMAVAIRTESKNAQASLTIEGLSKDVLKASQEIHEMLRSVRDQEDMEKKVKLTGTVVDWQYQQQGIHFQSFDPLTTYNLEQALAKKLQSVKVLIQGQSYTVAMPEGPATDSKGQTLQIKRIDKLKDEDMPVHWEAMPANTSCKVVPLTAGTAEHTEVLNLFKATCARNVTKIERIQNPILWKSLQIKKRDMEQRNKHKNNERRLFHGTCQTTVAYINQHGFNRSYGGKNAACYGNGTYFAVQASYSAQTTYAKPNANGEACMYLCRVLTGDFTLGQQHMIVPPNKGNGSLDMYDSVVNNVSNPAMFVIFHDSQACPEYLITFK